MQNESFVCGIVSSIPDINEFENLLERCENNRVRQATKGSSLNEKVTAIKKQLTELSRIMSTASKIKLDLSKGTQQLSLTATQKHSNLCSFVTLATQIKSMILKENLLGKLKRRVDQQQSRKSKPIAEIVDDCLILRCYNSGLTWEKAYLN